MSIDVNANLVLRHDICAEESSRWHIYIIECKDGCLYTGITNNIENRIKQHNRGHGCRFTKFRFPVQLRYEESCLTKSIALKREAEIKGWTRERKLKLIGCS